MTQYTSISIHHCTPTTRVVDVICSLFLANAGELKTQKTNIDHKICICDVILKSIFFKHHINYEVVLWNYICFDYCATAINASGDTDTPETERTKGIKPA